MIKDKDIEKLLGQSQEEYDKYLENGESDALAEAGELLWECLKIDMAKAAKTKAGNINSLMAAAALKGDDFTRLFYRCFHFHSWYAEGGVPKDFVLEKRLYKETVKTLQGMIENSEKARKLKRQVMESTA